VRVGVLDVALEDGHVAAESHRPDPGLVQELEQLILELRHVRVGVARADGPGDRLLRQMHRVVRRAADAHADDPRRARLAARADDRLEHELLDPLHAVGGDAHLEEAHVLAAGSLRDALDVEPVPARDEIPVHDREPVAGVRTGVLARDRVDGIRAQRMLDRRALGPGLQRRVDPGRMQREVLADAAGVDGDARVLADEVLLVAGDLHVPEDRGEDALSRHARLALRRVGEGVAQVLRDVLQRPDVQMRGGVLHDAFEVGGDVDAHTVDATPSSSCQRAAISSADAASISALACQAAVPKAPPAARTTAPETSQRSEAR
jgi:hypothetical protein